MEAEVMTWGERSQLVCEIRHLREALDEAWWREAPLEQILDLETRLSSCRQRLGEPANDPEN